MNKKKLQKIISIVLCIILVMSQGMCWVYADEGTGENGIPSTNQSINEVPSAGETAGGINASFADEAFDGDGDLSTDAYAVPLIRMAAIFINGPVTQHIAQGEKASPPEENPVRDAEEDRYYF
jgi:hypothetical protein